ncbi:hypothetical protein [Halocola ammonii]
MLTIFGKRKLNDNQVANIFVNSMIESVEKGFPEIAGFINDCPQFVRNPNIDPDDYGRFLMIVIAGNFNYIPRYFNQGHDQVIIRKCVEKFADVFEMKTNEFAQLIKEYKDYLKRVNMPSKTTLYAMSKGVFYKYNLNDFQEDYFKSLKTPNPIFLKNLDDMMKNFLWNWDKFSEKYKVTA